jgi:hypothetical protein
MESQHRLVAGLALALALVASTYIAAHSWVKVKSHVVRTIDVTGSAKRRIVSDLIRWDARLASQGSDATAAYKKLHENVEKTLDYLKKQGLTDDELRVSSVTTQELVETETVGSGEDRVEKQVARGWEASQTISVSSSQVEKVERVSREVTSLIESGVPVTSSPPAYLYTKLGELKIEMLAEASKDGRTRAERMLKSSGGGALGKLHSADMGVINVNPANSTSTAWDGNNDTTSLEKDIITIVHISFDID